MLDFTKFPARLEKDIADSFNFRQALERLKTGKSSTPRSWVYENIKDADVILKEWQKVLHSLDEVEELNEISAWDLSKSDKFGPQGGVAPFEERLETLNEYWSHLDSPPIFQQTDWRRAKNMAIKSLRWNGTGKPTPYWTVIDRGLREDKYNTSSGDPLFKKRKTTEAQRQALSAAEDGSWKQYYPVLGSRASMGKTGDKARWIFMFPMSVNVVEQSFQQPLQDSIRDKGLPFFAPWEGYSKVQKILSSCPQDTLKFGCDYTKMDQHFNLFHALEVYDVIKHYFKPQYREDLKQSIEYTFNCPVVSPKGLILGPHGMPSGSGWTNFLETMFNYILIWYFRIHYGVPIMEEYSMGIGDDQIWIIDYRQALSTNPKFKWSKDKFASFVTNVFKKCGLDANPEKQEVEWDMISFLQRRSYNWWSPSGIKYAGVYPTIRALTSEIFPEFYHNEKDWTKNTFALRCLMILENCVNHPLFKEFCLFIAKGNKNIVEFCTSPDAKILLTRHQAKKISNFIPTYNQEKAGVNPLEFKSLQIIREHFMKNN